MCEHPGGDDPHHGSPQLFSEVSRLTRAPRTLQRRGQPHWTIGGKPNGGYLFAMLGRAAVCGERSHHVIAASAHYLDHQNRARWRLEAEVLREGRSANQVGPAWPQRASPAWRRS